MYKWNVYTRKKSWKKTTNEMFYNEKSEYFFCCIQRKKIRFISIWLTASVERQTFFQLGLYFFLYFKRLFKKKKQTETATILIYIMLVKMFDLSFVLGNTKCNHYLENIYLDEEKLVMKEAVLHFSWRILQKIWSSRWAKWWESFKYTQFSVG